MATEISLAQYLTKFQDTDHVSSWRWIKERLWTEKDKYEIYTEITTWNSLNDIVTFM